MKKDGKSNDPIESDESMGADHYLKEFDPALREITSEFIFHFIKPKKLKNDLEGHAIFKIFYKSLTYIINMLEQSFSEVIFAIC